MNIKCIFSMALGLQNPWVLTNVEFKTVDNKKEQHINISFPKGEKFPDEHGTYVLFMTPQKKPDAT